MKKRILAILLAVICLSAMLVFASCGGGNDGGNDETDCSNGHAYGEWSVVTNESCTEAGLEKRVCADCGTAEEREIPAGHDWRTSTTEATCTEAGEKIIECRDCGETETEIIPAKGHSKKVTVEAVEPTLESVGRTEGAECEVCGEVLSVSEELPVLGNIIKKDFVTVVEGQSWHSFETPMDYLFDGKADTAPNAPKGTPYKLIIELGDAYVYYVQVVCNGMGTVYNAWNGSALSEAKYNVKTVAITCYKDEEVVAVQRFEDLDTNKVTEVTLEDVNCEVDTIEIYVESVGNNSNGDAYLWEINAVGKRTPTVCETNGHDWSDWTDVDYVDCSTPFKQQRVCSVCEKEEIKDVEAAGHTWTEWGFDIVGDPFVMESTCKDNGYIGRMCTLCGAEDTQLDDKLPHTWSAWDATGDCRNGGSRTRTCSACNETETETIEAGNHLNIVYDGAVAPTKEQDGQTGIKKCLSCGMQLAGNKILRYENVAINSEVSSNAKHWQVVGNDTWAPNSLLYLIDGKHNTGSPSCAQTAGTQWILLTFEEAVELTDVVVVVNGSGNLGALGNKEQTNFAVDVTITFFNDAGTPILTQTINTKDLISITVENTTGEAVKEIRVSYPTSYSAATLYLWEIEAYVINELSTCDATGHTWNDWTGTDAYCTPEGLVDGYKTRTCSSCGELETLEIKAFHDWTEWEYPGFDCTTGGTKTRECNSCGKEEREAVAAGDHINIELQGAIAPTLESAGYTGDHVCTACGSVTNRGEIIPPIENLAASASATTSAWCVTAGYLIDGKMNTGATGYGNAKSNTIHTLTWAEAVKFDTFKIYFNGDTTDKTLGGNMDGSFPSVYNNTNTDTTLTVKFYNAAGELINTTVISSKDITEYTITLEGTPEVAKVELDNYHGWSEARCLNIWEVQAYVNYVAE